MSTGQGGSDLAGFLAARPFTREEVFGEPCPVPDEPGVHGWWFRALPTEIDLSGCEQRDGLTLLFVGSSSGPPPASGERPSTPDLRKRVRYHFGGGSADAEGSTLRKSLGVLLAEELGLELRRVGSGARRTFAGGEAVLTRWMAEHALVSWVVRSEPWHFEEELIAALDVPLNIRGNERNAFHPELKRLRRQAVLKANKSRVLAEW
jgi:hypothetical protein